jgi:putative glutamine amidotransferase
VLGHSIEPRAAHLADSPIDVHFAEYSLKIAAAGGLPVELTEAADPNALMCRLDGLVLTGGADVDPRMWGSTPGPRQSPVRPERDCFEAALVGAAAEQGKPVLGICRGIQLINAHFGGTMVPHLPADQGEGHSYYGYQRHQRTHPVTFTSGSLFARLYGPGLMVNSFHHQAVDQPGDGLMVTGHAPDGVVEAIEHQSLPILGVQWHPEMLREIEPIFAWLISSAS